MTWQPILQKESRLHFWTTTNGRLSLQVCECTRRYVKRTTCMSKDRAGMATRIMPAAFSCTTSAQALDANDCTLLLRLWTNTSKSKLDQEGSGLLPRLDRKSVV